MARLGFLMVAMAVTFSGCGGSGGGTPTATATPTPTLTPTPTPTPEPGCAREVSGVLAGVTSWSDGPVCVVGDLFLPPSAALGISAGVEVRFLGRFALVLQAGSRLATAGSASAPVLFASGADAPLPGDWGPILTDSGAQLTLRGTVLSHGAGIQTFESTLTIEDSTIRANEASAAPAILAAELGTVTIHRSTFEESEATCVSLSRSGGEVDHSSFIGCTGDAIVVSADAGDPLPLVRNDLFRANAGAGLHVSGPVNFTGISRNVFEQNGLGILVEGGATFVARDNHLLDAYAIRAAGTGASSATDNWWGTVDPAEIEAHIIAPGSHPVSFDPFLLAPVPGAGP